MKDLFSLEGKIALVTGGSTGIGEMIAEGFLHFGAKVYIVARREGILRKTQEKLSKIGLCEYIVADLGSVNGVETLAKTFCEREQSLDILVNNAGILRDKTFSKLELENWHAVIDVHLTGSLNATKCVWPIMVEQKYGRIIMTTSTSGLFGNFGQANYGAAKLGLVGFMNTLRFEGAKYNVFTNAIAPIAATRMTVELPGFEGSVEKLAPELVTPAVVYLCSEKAPNVRIIQAAGGRYYSADVRENVGVNLGLGASVEDIEANIETILDMGSNAGILERTPHR